MPDAPTRLNKYLALHLGTSRREADDMIASGRVTMNDVSAVLGARISPGDIVKLDGAPIADETKLTCLLFNKPRNYICSRAQQGDTRTIYALLPPEFHQLKPVGRLDKDSSGLLLLTNDGDFAHRMTHPSFHTQKTYLVTLDRDLEPLHQQMISEFGVMLDDGKSQLRLERQTDDTRTDWIVLLHEGRNRQIRRTFAALGYTVSTLHRTQFGHYSLGDIHSGKWKSITIS